MNPFPVSWIHGSLNCSTNADAPLQAHACDADTFIIRQNKCHNFEGPFMYLLIGAQKALLLDTGASPSAGHPLPMRTTVDSLVPPSRSLIVAHSHSHADHCFGDEQFAARPNTTVIQPNFSAMCDFFGFHDWPNDVAMLDLGKRKLAVVPIPGHESTHICVYDEATQILMTGDTLYPGLLVINDLPAYRASAARLKRFADGKAITYILGAHIEMKRPPGPLYPIGTRYQPDEHVLQLTRAHLDAWSDAVADIGNNPQPVVRDDFVLQPP